jgi:WD40 repeat protein
MTTTGRLYIVAALALLIFSFSEPVFAAKRAALVIGNSNYVNVARLPNPVKDAAAIAVSLSRLGFDVTHRENLGAAAMREALSSFEDKANGADWALVYYAGHGLELDGKNWLLPVDAKLARASDVADEATSLDRVLERVRPASALRIVILDACRNNPFLAKMDMGRGGPRSLGRGLAAIQPQRGEVVFYAARDGHAARDGEGAHSPFAQALLAHMEKPGLELGYFFREVTSDVQEATAPDSQEPFVYGSLPRQKFYFKAPEEASARPDAPPAAQSPTPAATPQPKPEPRVAAAKPEHQPAQPAPKPMSRRQNADQRLIRTFAGHTAKVDSVAFSPDGLLALSGAGDKKLKLWDVASGREIRTFAGHAGGVRSVAFSPDGRLALSGASDSALKLWDVASGREVWTISKRHKGDVNSVAFSPDGGLALSGDDNGVIKLWDTASSREVKVFAWRGGHATAVGFSPDGRNVLSSSSLGQLKLWSITSGRTIWTLEPGGWIYQAAFSPDGRFIFSANIQLEVWDAASGQKIRSFSGGGVICSAAFSPDSRFALSGDFEGTVRLWDIVKGGEAATFVGHTNIVDSVAFSPDARFALSGGQDSVLKLWDLSEWTRPEQARR